MPLPTPILDDRSWDDLREELVRRIPVYNPEWTDHNASDPGITLLELFAFLGENLLFRFNQIPDATRLAFLRLLGVPLRPAVPAEGIVAMSTRLPAGELVPLASEARAGDLPFETRQEVHVLPLESAVLVKRLASDPETPEEVAFTRAARRAIGELQPTERIAYYHAEQLEAPDAPGARPLDAPHAVDGMIWVAVLRTRQTDPRELAGRILNLGFLPEEEVASMDEVDPCRGAGSGEPPPAVLWQASTAGTAGPRRTPEYLRLEVVGDSTEGLTRAGTVRLQLPRDVEALGVPADVELELDGAGDLPPALEDPEQAESVLFWLRASRIRDARPFRPVVWMGLNATEVVQLRRAQPELLGTGTGQPHQRYRLLEGDVVPGSLTLQVEEAGEWRAWEEVEGLEASGRDARHYLLDAEAGLVTFGNGTTGRVPHAGERIRAVGYRFGGGARGNLPARAISRLPFHAAVKVENPVRTRGGADAESLEAALERVPGEVRRRDRAVTAGDFEELALATPGAHVARAETLALFHPPSRQLDRPGVVSVVVWPREDPRRPNAPLPDRAVLRRVCDWLDARRLVTTELWVIPPTYRKIAVAVGLSVKPGYGVEAVRRWVELVLRQYLAPLPPYGPEGRGWPLGRRVHGPELEAAALQVEGVAYLEGDLRVAAWDADARLWREDGPTVTLERWEVPELWEITVVEGRPLAPGTAVGPLLPVPSAPRPDRRPAPPPRPGTSVGAVAPGAAPDRPLPLPVPIPVPRREC
jgi:hypothetical protein